MDTFVLLGLSGAGLLVAAVGSYHLARHLHTYPFTAGYLLGGTATVALVSLTVAASALKQLPAGFVTMALLVGINVLVQPLFLLLCVGGVYKFGMALCGQATYAFRAIPREDIPRDEYRWLLWHCVMSGAVGVAFAGGLAYLCLLPLL